MMVQPWELALAAVLLVSAATDIAKGLIYNWITLPGMAMGLFLGLYFGGWQGLGMAALGLLAGGALLMLPFISGAMGGGDVKLMAAIGALGGALFALKVVMYASLAGGLWALVRLALSGKLLEGLGRTWAFTRGVFQPGSAPEPRGETKLPGVPFGACLLAGALLARYADFMAGIWRG